MTIKETVAIPPGSEMIVEGSMSHHNFATGYGIVKPVQSLLKKNTVLLAPTLTLSDSPEVPLRVLNPTEELVVLYKGASAGLFQVIDAVRPHMTSEDDNRCDAKSEHVNQIKTRERKASTSVNHELPQSLQEMLQHGSTQLNSDERSQLSQLIRENQCLFSLSKDDIGLSL